MDRVVFDPTPILGNCPRLEPFAYHTVDGWSSIAGQFCESGLARPTLIRVDQVMTYREELFTCGEL